MRHVHVHIHDARLLRRRRDSGSIGGPLTGTWISGEGSGMGLASEKQRASFMAINNQDPPLEKVVERMGHPF